MGGWPAAARSLATCASPGVVIAGLGLPDVGVAAVALLAWLTAAFAAAGVTR